MNEDKDFEPFGPGVSHISHRDFVLWLWGYQEANPNSIDDNVRRRLSSQLAQAVKEKLLSEDEAYRRWGNPATTLTPGMKYAPNTGTPPPNLPVSVSVSNSTQSAV